MTDVPPFVLEDVIQIDASGLSAADRQGLATILRRASLAPSIGPAVADQLSRAAAHARLLIPEDVRIAVMSRRLDDFLDQKGNTR